MSSKKIALPKPRKGKALVPILLVIGLYFVLTDPIGSSESVKHVFTNISTFVSNVGGGR